MDFKLTSNSQYSHHDKDGSDRNYLSYYLNDVLILKQKIPFDTSFEKGFDRRTTIYDEYILNDKLYQKRKKKTSDAHTQIMMNLKFVKYHFRYQKRN